jgi:hypothetical protein
MERSAIRWCLVIVQEFIYYLPCPKTMQPFAIRWCLSLFRNSFITSPVQILWNVLPSGGVCHCSGIHLLPPLCKYYRMLCHQVVSVIVQEFIYYLLCPKTMQPFAIRWCLSLFSNWFITSPVQRLSHQVVSHCSGILFHFSLGTLKQNLTEMVTSNLYPTYNNHQWCNG